MYNKEAPCSVWHMCRCHRCCRHRRRCLPACLPADPVRIDAVQAKTSMAAPADAACSATSSGR